MTDITRLNNRRLNIKKMNKPDGTWEDHRALLVNVEMWQRMQEGLTRLLQPGVMQELLQCGSLA